MISLFQYYRVFAAYLILLIHQQFWAMPLALERLTGVAVPLFAAMSGFLFAPHLCEDNQMLTTLAKKVKRILVPYLIWAVIYWIANGVVLDVLVKHEPLSIPGIRSWLLGGTACHLWFLPCLFLSFAVYAFGCGMIGRVAAVDCVWGGTMAFDVVILLLAVLSQFIQDSTSATFAGYAKIYLGRLVFYFALGHMLALGMKLMDGVKVTARLFIGGTLVIVGCSNVVFDWLAGLVCNPLLFVIGLLVVAKAIPNVKVPCWIAKMAETSMGIYLVHVLFTSGANFMLQKIDYSPLPASMGFTLSVVLFAVSYLTVRSLPKRCF